MIQRIAIIIAIVCLYTNIALAAELNKIVAVVNGEMISMHDLDDTANSELKNLGIPKGDPRAAEVRRGVLDAMIDNILYKHEAERFKINVSDSDIDAEIKKIMQSAGKGNIKDFEVELLRQGTTLPAFKEKISSNIMRQRLISSVVTRKIIVTDDEIKEYYEKHQNEFNEKLVDFSFIVFDKSVNAQKVYQQIQKNTLDFAKAAKQYSIDSSAENGGEFKSIPLMALPGGMQQQLLQLNPGQMSKLIPLDDKTGLLRLNKMHAGQNLPLERAKPVIEARLRDEKASLRLKEYSEQLRKKAVIDIRL